MTSDVFDIVIIHIIQAEAAKRGRLSIWTVYNRPRDYPTGWVRFLKGHKKSSPGRPLGAINRITKSLREQVLDGIGDIPTFIRELKQDSLPACAGLLSKLIPPQPEEADPEVGRVISVTIGPIRSGTYIMPDGFDGPVPPNLRLVVSDDAPIDTPPDPAA